MLNLNNNASNLKREILSRIAKLVLEDKLASGVHYIARELAPRGGKALYCCVYHDREILRMRTIAALGISIENYNDDKPLLDYANEALQRKAPTTPILTVLDEACHACVRSHYMVTNACQGCFARPCMVNCPKKAITVTRNAAIDPNKCVNCGMCLQNCPYHAIIRIPVPCEDACPVGAIKKAQDGREYIDFDKCTFCGMCIRSCPFGAVVDKSQMVDVLLQIKAKSKKVVAMYAPAIAAQFKATRGQLEVALETLGFDKVYEVALGADVCADKEAKEFEERMQKGDKMMTTSCCPAYVRAVRIHNVALSPCISETRTPMHYTAEIAKKDNPDCLTVFIGPCIAKKKEGIDDDLVDYVLTIEEVGAMFMAKGIDIASLSDREASVIPTKTGRGFASSGGVAQAVVARLPNKDICRPTAINGLNKDGMKKLSLYAMMNSGKVPIKDDSPNLIEVMACEGGCIGGPSVITNPKVAQVLLAPYIKDGSD